MVLVGLMSMFSFFTIDQWNSMILNEFRFLSRLFYTLEIFLRLWHGVAKAPGYELLQTLSVCHLNSTTFFSQNPSASLSCLQLLACCWLFLVIKIFCLQTKMTDFSRYTTTDSWGGRFYIFKAG